MIKTLEEAIEAAIEIAERLREPTNWDSDETELVRLLRLIETLTEREGARGDSPHVITVRRET